MNSIESYELKESRDGDLVPVINGVHLHSIYNPTKEALSFIENNQQNINANTNFLIFGLGFGYHVDALVEHLESLNYTSYSIIVIEPNTKLVNDFNNLRGFKNHRVSITSPMNSSEVFENYDFVQFLKSKPALLKHELSFDLEKDFYKDFLSYKAPVLFKDYKHLLTPTIRDAYFTEQAQSFESRLNTIKTNTGAQTKLDFALLAIDSLR